MPPPGRPCDGGRWADSRSEDIARRAQHRHEVELEFDEYAEEFEDYLLHSLKYDFPRACQEKVAGLPRRFRRCLDLGCGTGLCGRALREGPAGEALEWLEGCDLSARMLEKARNAGGYDALHKRDLLGHLQRQPGASFDLLVAGDVFIYVLSLRPVLREARRVLEPGGALVFSTEAAAEDEEAQEVRQGRSACDGVGPGLPASTPRRLTTLNAVTQNSQPS